MDLDRSRDNIRLPVVVRYVNSPRDSGSHNDVHGQRRPAIPSTRVAHLLLQAFIYHAFEHEISFMPSWKTSEQEKPASNSGELGMAATNPVDAQHKT
jgi:hypothetical protein